MGCNCRNKKDVFARLADEMDDNKKKSIFVKILEKILTLLFGIFMGVLFIIMAVPLVIYVLICIIFGKQPTLKIKNLEKYISKNDRN